MTIRHAQIADLESIIDVYNQAVLTKQATSDLKPVDVNSRLKWFEEHTPDKYPIFVCEIDGKIGGWISLSPYRSGREALRFTAEVSYYVHSDFQGKRIGSKLLDYVLKECPKYQIKNLFAIILEHNIRSIKLVEKFNFEKWGLLPNVADFDGKEYGHLYYGLRVV
ncbi:MAG: GNAT family N-acetyltransferase [Acetivibrionales bacterium]